MKSLFSPQRLSWYLWDFGTQILLVNASVYFVEWLVIDNGVPDFWYSFAFIASTIVLIFASPYLGVVVDRGGRRARLFFLLTVLTIAAGAGIELAAGLDSFAWRVTLALAAFALLNFFFQLASVVFNTFLKDIATERNVGRVSGLGSGFSTIGDAVGLLATLPIILGTAVFLGRSRVSVLIPAALLAALFCLPAHFAFRGHKDPLAPASAKKPVFREIWRDLKDAERYPGVGRLLLAYCFYNDAILTLQLFAPIYLDKVYGIPDSQKVVIIMIVYLSFAVGAWVGGYVGDHKGNKPSLLAGVIVTGAVIAALALVPAGPFVYILFGLFGIGTGVAFANTKALFAKLIPYEKKAQFFGVYAIFERFASIIGPIAWGLVTYLVTSSGALNYRMAALAMSLFLFAGAYVARKVREPKGLAEIFLPAERY